jgi:phospholipid/cholesterol/gamma-HCH transport system substrate-binding protein
MQMKIKSEVKIGLVGIVTLVLIIWGVKFLLGSNIFENKLQYFATYEQVNGLESAAPVMMKGYKIGIVSDVKFDPESSPPFTVTIRIDKDYSLRSGSTAEIFSADLLGSKAIRIKDAKSDTYYAENDTLLSAVIPDMLASVMDDITPVLENFNSLTLTLDSVGISLNSLLSDPSTLGSIQNINRATGSLKSSLSKNGDIAISLENLSSITTNLKNQNEEIAATMANLHSLSNDIENADMDSILINLDLITVSLKNITQQIESGDGTVGKLIYNDSLYDHISSLSADLDTLIIDIKNNPKKYLRFSVFGK